MKKILGFLILFAAISAYATQGTYTSGAPNDAASWGLGSIGSTDTLIANSGSAAMTATGNLICGKLITTSGYSGNITFAGYTITLNSGGVSVSGTGTLNPGNGMTFNGANDSIYVASGSGAFSPYQCIVTINGSCVIKSDRGSDYKQLVGANNAKITFPSSCEIYNGTSVPLILGNDCKITVASSKNLTILRNANGDLTTLGTNDTFSVSGNIQFGFGGTGKKVTLPAITTSGVGGLVLTKTGTVSSDTIKITGSIISRAQTITMNVTAGNFVDFNRQIVFSHGFTLTSGTIINGSMPVYPQKLADTLGRAMVDTLFYIGNKDSVTFVGTFPTGLSGSSSTGYISGTPSALSAQTIIKSIIWYGGAPLDSCYDSLTVVGYDDLFMGHSMLTNMSATSSPPTYYEQQYAHRSVINKTIGGTTISDVEPRVDSCLSAYMPTRFFMWIGFNELFYVADSAAFETAYTTYMQKWVSIISKVKTFGIDSIYLLECTIANGATVRRQNCIQLFNKRLKDSCVAEHLYYIEAYSQLLKSGTSDTLNPLYSDDGVHPNSTDTGSRFCAHLLNTGYIPTASLPTFTLSKNPWTKNANNIPDTCVITPTGATINSYSFKWRQKLP